MAVTAVRSCWVLAKGVRTHYTQCGDAGPAVVLCHGAGPGGSGHAGFRRMIPALAEHFQVYAPDQLSFGQTDARPHAWPVRGYQSLVDHVADFLEALCLDEVMLAGNSQGAYVAAKVALDHPEKVKKLFLIGSGTISAAMGTPMPATAGTGALRGFDGTAAGMRAFLSTVVLDQSTITDDLVAERMANVSRPGVAEARKAFADGRARMERDPNLFQAFDLRGRLPALTIPARFIWGKQDGYAVPELGIQLEKQLPNIPFTWIDHAGHQVQTDQPDLVNRMVAEFFLEP